MQSNGHHKSSTTLEREAEQSRAQLSATLDELRGRMTPGQVVDQFISYSKESGGADFFRNLGDQVRTNPLPVAVVGLGLGWLMMSGRSSGGRADSWSYGASDSSVDFSRRNSAGGVTGKFRDAGTSITGAAGHVRDRVSGAAQATGEAASRAASTVQDGIGSARDMASSVGSSVSTAGSRIAEGVSSVSQRAADTGSSLMDSGRRVFHDGQTGMSHIASMFREQPLLLAALGVAIGAAIGTSLPKTRAEDRYLGPASDSLREQAKEMASQGIESAKEAAGSVVESGKEEAKEQGLSANSFGEAIDKASAVAEKTISSATKESGKILGASESKDGKKSDAVDKSDSTAKSEPGRQERPAFGTV